LSYLNYNDIHKLFSSCVGQYECPNVLNNLVINLEKITSTLVASNEELAISLLAPIPHLVNAIIGYRKGHAHYPHVLTDSGLVVEGSLKSLYNIVLGKSLLGRINVENIAKEFENQTNYNDFRIRKLLPVSWVNVYSIRNRKTAAHYGPISEQTDALYSLIGSIYIIINHIEFIKLFLADPLVQVQLNGLNFETVLLETVNEVLMFPVIPTSVIQFSTDGPTIVSSAKLSQQQAIALIFYALPFTKYEYSFALIEKLLKISGKIIKSLPGQISNMVGTGTLTRIGDKVILTNKGIREVQELLEKIS